MKDLFDRKADSIAFWLILDAFIAVFLCVVAYHVIVWMIESSVS